MSLLNQSEESATSAKENIKEEAINYEIDGKKYDGYVYYNEEQKGKRPAILVVHEWWGLNDYSRRRAKQLAELGYISMAVDVFGNGKTAEDPTGAQNLAMPFYKDPTLAKARLDPAIALLKTYPQTDASKMGAIGYCFGGNVVLNAAKLGADLRGVVSFHGSLSGVKPSKDLLKAKILVCHGAEDPMANPDVAGFKKDMDAAGADYIFKVYPGATHAFSNPNATAKGEKYNMPIRYNEAADKASWSDMKDFFQKIF
ncbi:MAG TPA: dienelactone hydrolase family protein [Hanamia sp.]|nr:dienelactone hydrolase family protein [Hanamia sp.]